MVACESVKTKEKSSWVISKVVAVAYGSGRLQELFITKFKSQLKRRCTKVVVTKADHESNRKESFDCNDVILRAESGKQTHYYKLSKINTKQDRDEAAELFWSLKQC